MKLTNHDAATLVRRGSCPRNPWLVFLLATFFAVAGLAPAWANPLVDPIFNPNNDGNPKCTDLGFEYGFKLDLGWDEGLLGVWDIWYAGDAPSGDVSVTSKTAPPGTTKVGEVEIFLADDCFTAADAGRSEGSCIGFESTVGTGGFIVKGGPNANFYDYRPDFGPDSITFDTNLSTPLNTISGNYPGTSHADLCFDAFPTITVEKTATGAFELEYEWEITKTATPLSANIFFGDTQTFDYTVSVIPDEGTRTNFRVNGDITIENVSAVDVVINAVTDEFDGAIGDVEVTCPVDLPATLLPGQTMVCTYKGASNGNPGTNTATVSFNGVGSAQATDDFDFEGEPAGLISSVVNVIDSFEDGDPTNVGFCDVEVDSDGCTFDTYSVTLDCEAIEGENSGKSESFINVARIVGTEVDGEAPVTLACYKPSVAKTADPAFTREYFWTVDKSYEGDDPALLMEGTAYELEYTIVVGLDDPASEDSDWAVSGSITVTNPAPIAAVIDSVSDSFPGGSDITIDCGDNDGGVGPYTIAANGGSLTCDYSGDSNGTDGINTATAVQQNYARAADGSTTANGTTDYTGTADFAFVTPTNPVNACVDVIDLLSIDGIEVDLELLIQAGFDPEEASVCSDEAPATFTYTIEDVWFADGDSSAEPPICELVVDNEARVVTRADPDVVLASDLVTITLSNEDCGPLGCTLTRGYWQTHSQYGPAPYDDNWANVVPDGEDTIFFLSNQTWYEVFWTPPAGGNVYYRLAPQYMAAALNVLNGAFIDPGVLADWNDATELFERCGPEDFAQRRRGRFALPQGECADDAARAGEIAEVLDAYNNGLLGTPKCSENDN